MAGLLTRLLRRWRYGQEVIVVSGLPRSGTSMMMRMLDAAGVPILVDEIREADEDNPRGYFELERVKHLEKDDDKSWVTDARGRALKVISQLLQELPPENFYRVVFMERDIDEVLASQNRMLERRRESNPLDDAEAKQRFERHVLAVKFRLVDRPNFDLLAVRYDEVVANPHAAALRICGYLGMGLDPERMVSAVERDLYRNRRPRSEQV
jgi:hypothetical protein